MKIVTFSSANSLWQKAVFASLILLFISPLFAQDGVKDNRYGGFARLYSMGDNPYIVDPDNIRNNPAYSSVYSNFLWGDIGSSVADPEDGSGQFAGFNYSVNKDLTLGILLTRSDFGSSSIGSLDPINIVGLINSVEPGADIVPLDNNTELLGAYSFGNYVFGIGLSYASTTNDFRPATGSEDQNSADQFGVNLGLIGNLSSDFKFDAAFTLLLPSATYEPAVGDKLDASNTLILVNARGFWKLSNKVSFVPNVVFYSATGDFETGGQSVDLPSSRGIQFGVGFTYRYENLLISGGPSFAYETMDIPGIGGAQPELEDSRTTFPAWNLGAEWFFTDWLVGRAGYVASTFSNTFQSPASATTVDEFRVTTFGRGDVRLGVGFRFGGFSLDATVNDDVLREGFNLVGGGTKSFAYLSASFAF